MANLSSAYGTCTLTCPTKKLDSILELLSKTQNEFYYNLGLYELDNYQKDPEETKKQLTIQPSTIPNKNIFPVLLFSTIEFALSGFGRWTFENNIRGFIEGVQSDEALNPLLNAIEQTDQPIELYFDFIDYEPGCEVFYTAQIKIIYDPEEKKWSTEEVSDANLDITAKNLIDYGVCDFAIDKYNVCEALVSYLNQPYISLNWVDEITEETLIEVFREEDLVDLLEQLRENTDGVYDNLEEWLDSNDMNGYTTMQEIIDNYLEQKQK